MRSFVIFALIFIFGIQRVLNADIVRNKRFFQNLFSKTAVTEPSASISISNSCEKSENCSNGGTPATYLTPPTIDENKYFSSDYGRKYLIGDEFRANDPGILDGTGRAHAPNFSTIANSYATWATAAAHESLQVKLKGTIFFQF